MLLKKGILAIGIILILVASAVFAEDISLTLTRKNYGAAQSFEGYINFTMDGEIPYDSPVAFAIGDSQVGSQKSFGDMIGFVKKGKILQKSYDFGDDTSEIDVTFESNGTVVPMAVDLRNAVSFSPDTQMSFQVEAASPVDNPRININNDNSTEWVYIGNSLDGVFPDSKAFFVNDSYYIKDFNTIGGKIDILDKKPNEIFCEKVIVEPSKEYYIESKLAMKDAGGKLWGALYIKVPGTAPEECTAENGCFLCDSAFNPLSSMQSLHCLVNRGFNYKQELFACVFQAIDNERYGNYTIGQESSSKLVNVGYRNGKVTNGNDYLIRVYSHKFETKLSGTTNIVLDRKALDKAGVKVNKNRYLIAVSSDSAGELKFTNLKVNYEAGEGSFTRESFTPVFETPRRINYSGAVNVPLSYFSDVIAPSEINTDYVLQAAILTGPDPDTDVLLSNPFDFKVIEGPKAVIKISNPLPTVSESMKFDGSLSQPRNKTNYPIVSYSWNFGDNTTANGSTVNHAFAKEGEYIVVLTVADKEGIAGRTSVSIEALAVSGSIYEQLNKSINFIRDAQSNLANSNAVVKDTAKMLGITDRFNSIEANVTGLIMQADEINADEKLNESEKNKKLVGIKVQVDKLMEGVPLNMDVSMVGFDAKADSLGAIPDAKTLKLAEDEQFGEKVLKAQEGVEVKGEARKVKVQYSSGKTDDFVLIKKTISGGSGDIYEVLPSGLTKRNITTKGYEAVTPDGSIFKFSGVSEIVYSATGDADKAVEAKTIIIPKDLSTITIDEGATPAEEVPNVIETKAVCGNSICEKGEDKSCPNDCTQRPWGWIIGIIIAGLVIAGGAYYFLTYGKNLFKSSSSATLFKNERDHLSLKSYIEEALHKKGFTEAQVMLALKKKGWADQQINSVIGEVKSKQPGAEQKPKPEIKNEQGHKAV